MVYRILHLADLHLEHSFAAIGLNSAVGATLRQDLRATLGRILSLARERHVDAVTIAGDLYDQEYSRPDTTEFLVQQFSRLAPIRVIIAPGECDPYTNDSLYAVACWPSNVKVFTEGRLAKIELAPSLYLWGGACPPLPTEETLKAHAKPEDVNLLLLHAVEVGSLVGKGVFRWTSRVLKEGRWNCALLGHNHHGCQWSDVGNQGVYPGSPEPLSWEESSTPHTVALISIDQSAVQIEMIPINQWRYCDLKVDLSGCQTQEDAVLNVQGAMGHNVELGHRPIYRVSLTGNLTFPLDLENLANQVAVEAQVTWSTAFTSRYNLEELAKEQTVRGLLVRRLQERLYTTKGEERRRLLTALELALRVLDGKQVGLHEID